MKKLLFAASAVLLSTGAFAQTQEMGWGLKAGVNFPKYHFSNANNNDFSETNSTTNFHITAFLDAPIVSDYLYIQPGVSYQGKGAELTRLENNNSSYVVTQNTAWIEVPVNVVFKAPIGGAGHIFVGAGPYIGFGISGKNKYDSSNPITGDNTRYGEEFEFGDNGDLKGTDFGLNFIGGYEFNGGLLIHGGYGMGLTNLAPSLDNSNLKQTNRVWTVGLGFKI